MAVENRHERLVSTVTKVGTDWVITELTNAPAVFLVRRVRALVSSGTATTLALRVSEIADPTDLEIPLEYGLLAAPIDEPWPEEYTLVVYSGVRNSSLNNRGSVWVAVKADTTGNTVKFLIDIEVVDG
jgi:hypothetical protein